MSSLKKGRPGGVQGRHLVQMLDRQRAQQAAEDAAKKAVIAARNLVDATKEREETSIAAAAAAALSTSEEAQVSLSGSTSMAACCSVRMYLTVTAACYSAHMKHRSCNRYCKCVSLFIERTSPLASTKPSTRKPARLAII
jgi:hypothetical protein